MTRHSPTAPRATHAPRAQTHPPRGAKRLPRPVRRAAAVGMSAGILISVPVAAAHSEGSTSGDHDAGHDTSASAPLARDKATQDEAGHATAERDQTTSRASRRDRSADGASVIRLASREHGKPYEWGADGPDAYDCSGFTRHVFAQTGRELPRTSAAQYEAVRHVPRADVQVGDLVFTRTEDGEIYHVGIYAGDHRIWAATKPGDTVRTQEIWTDDYVVGRP
ncbi:MAG: C40 family peptidase [Actinomycetes bacterium]